MYSFMDWEPVEVAQLLVFNIGLFFSPDAHAYNDDGRDHDDDDDDANDSNDHHYQRFCTPAIHSH